MSPPYAYFTLTIRYLLLNESDARRKSGELFFFTAAITPSYDAISQPVSLVLVRAYGHDAAGLFRRAYIMR